MRFPLVGVGLLVFLFFTLGRYRDREKPPTPTAASPFLWDGCESYYIGGYWLLTRVPEEYSITYNTTRPAFQFETLPGYQYTVVREIPGPDGAMHYPQLFPPTLFDHTDGNGNPVGGTDEVDLTQPNGGFLIDDIFYAFPTTLVRHSQPLGSVQIVDASGNVLTPNVGVGGSADLWLPPDGHVILQLNDLSNHLIAPSVGAVGWSILDALGNILRSGTGIDLRAV